MVGKTVYVDTTGFLYLLNTDASRTYLTGPLAGRTISSSGSNTSSTPVDGTNSLTLIYRDDQGTFTLDSQGQKKYLSYVSGTSTQQTYQDSTGANYIILTDSNGNKYTKNADGTRNYLTGFTTNPLSTYISKVDSNGV